MKMNIIANNTVNNSQADTANQLSFKDSFVVVDAKESCEHYGFNQINEIKPVMPQDSNISLLDINMQETEDDRQTIESGKQNCQIQLAVKPSNHGLQNALDLFDDDDMTEIDEEELMQEPLNLITGDIAMKVQSELLRENRPAVLLQPYKFQSYDNNALSRQHGHYFCQ